MHAVVRAAGPSFWSGRIAGRVLAERERERKSGRGRLMLLCLFDRDGLNIAGAFLLFCFFLLESATLLQACQVDKTKG